MCDWTYLIVALLPLTLPMVYYLCIELLMEIAGSICLHRCYLLPPMLFLTGSLVTALDYKWATFSYSFSFFVMCGYTVLSTRGCTYLSARGHDCHSLLFWTLMAQYLSSTSSPAGSLVRVGSRAVMIATMAY